MKRSALITPAISIVPALKNTGDFTEAQWDGILKAMAPKAKLSGDETKQVEAYIKANAKK